MSKKDEAPDCPYCHYPMVKDALSETGYSCDGDWITGGECPNKPIATDSKKNEPLVMLLSFESDEFPAVRISNHTAEIVSRGMIFSSVPLGTIPNDAGATIVIADPFYVIEMLLKKVKGPIKVVSEFIKLVAPEEVVVRIDNLELVGARGRGMGNEHCVEIDLADPKKLADHFAKFIAALFPKRSFLDRVFSVGGVMKHKPDDRRVGDNPPEAILPKGKKK